MKTRIDLLSPLDKLAGWWIDKRMTGMVVSDPEMEDFELKRAEMGDNGLTIEGISPIVAVLAEQAALMLDFANAENYVQFDFVPRLDRGLRPIRVMVGWANGKLPALRVIEMEKQVAELQAELAALQAQGSHSHD